MHNTDAVVRGNGSKREEYIMRLILTGHGHHLQNERNVVAGDSMRRLKRHILWFPKNPAITPLIIDHCVANEPPVRPSPHGTDTTQPIRSATDCPRPA
jgi:hypothetical protein